ncbi:MAG TPA: UDP-N-acetylglucosamine 2-epimerase (non-hydrolyzing) [Terriglobia bacterium]|nr:UDP-N-acetylglucosamine 2-epimerase (non-hydrolyzing) [Terriglobia bacterium]
MTIVGTRPEIIKLSRVIPELDKHAEHVLVHTGQNPDYQLNNVFFDELGIREPDERHDTAIRGGKSPPELIGDYLSVVDQALARHEPDAVLVLGDTNSALSVYAAKRRHIPIFHMEAGNRCFDERVPEEVNRRIIDHIADINMPYTEHARRNLLAGGIAPDRIIKTGSPMREVLDHYIPASVNSDVLERLSLVSRDYYVVSAHREENIDDDTRFAALTEMIARLAQDVPVVWSIHPRVMSRRHHQYGPFSNVIMHKPFGFPDYMKLQINARCVISDSGTLTEEAAMMGFPAVQIRQAHERPEGMDAGVMIMSDLRTEQVLDAVRLAAEQDTSSVVVPDYCDHLVAQKVVRIILSYTDYVRRVVWRS